MQTVKSLTPESLEEEPFSSFSEFQMCEYGIQYLVSKSDKVTMDYRALAVRNEKSVIWYWIGDHNKYEQLLKAL